VLDQVAPARASPLCIRQKLAHDIELMEARPDLHRLLAAGLRVFDFDDLRIVLENVGEAGTREKTLPEVIGLEAIRVGRIARTVVPAEIERQEPGTLALQVRAEAHLVVVDSKVHHAAAELEEFLARVAIALKLLNRVLDRLLGQAVLQLEGGDGQAIDAESEIERALGFVTAVTKLTGDAEPICGVKLGGLDVAG
jgi:hypothetical protein